MYTSNEFPIKARHLEFGHLQKIEDLRMHYTIERFLTLLNIKRYLFIINTVYLS
jgi:hypothetical protein